VDDLLARRSAKYSTYPPDVLPAWVAEMDFDLAPPVKAALRAAIENDDAGYLGADHDWLLSAFADFAARRLDWKVDPACVVAVTDVMVGVEELLLVLTSPGDGVIVNPPVYPPYYADIVHAGRRVVPVPVSGDGALDLAGIDAAFGAGARALLLWNPHNPTGRVLPLQELLDAHHHVGAGDDLRGLHLPAQPPRGEARERVQQPVVPGAEIAAVVVLHGRPQRGLDRRGEVEVHLRNPRGQHVGGVGGVLGAVTG